MSEINDFDSLFKDAAGQKGVHICSSPKDVISSQRVDMFTDKQNEQTLTKKLTGDETLHENERDLNLKAIESISKISDLGDPF